jgi:hypothetical protein
MSASGGQRATIQRSRMSCRRVGVRSLDAAADMRAKFHNESAECDANRFVDPAPKPTRHDGRGLPVIRFGPVP